MKVRRLVLIALLLFSTNKGEKAIASPLILVDSGDRISQFDIAKRPISTPLTQGNKKRTDFHYESSHLISNYLYRRLSKSYNAISPSGAHSANIDWERHRTNKWYIEAQRYGEGLVIGGLVSNNPQAIQAGFKMFDWGFKQQAADGSFKGTGDPFHSTSFFVQAVAHSLLVIQQSPQANKYAAQVSRYKPLVRRAARWMISQDVWKQGIKRNQPYTHRRYAVAVALGLTSKLTGDAELMKYARQSLQEGLTLQRPNGINPEKGGHDSSYQMVGVVYAQRWVTYFPDDPLTPKVKTAIEKALAWQQTRISASGEISTQGNTRTAGQETGRTGKVKAVDYNMVIRGFAYWAAVTQNSKWGAIAQKIAKFYY
ncbi:hypothetical protein C7Y66_17220 [Chroococcidiopsis sp. CCALA 051]|uniref:hypothetical protein n=1 Tax=Chroococcidiopsis sp. CCALA 051 TaxID=869949 RepID=UPI000D0D4644|nr:hypothetical protein [Chroococcidiopsis sp. CCALA 051]PSM47919.1 hypothetical protein C7Y66_17220 [Chroococcidiopsis sp. CCALA 051]